MLDLSHCTINPDSFCRGCVTEEEKAAILRSVEYMAVNYVHNKPVFVEVGTLFGGTAEAIVRVLLTLQRTALVWTIDRTEWPGAKPRLDGFYKPVTLKVMRGISWEIASTVPQPLVWVFIDGGHRTKDVSMDIAAFAPIVQSGGLLLFHDTNPGQGVLAAIATSDIMQQEYTLVYEIQPVPSFGSSPTKPWGGLQIYQRRCIY